MKKRRTQNLLMGLLCISLFGCAEIDREAAESEELVEASTVSQEYAYVTPVFQVFGWEGISENLILEKLGLVISEIRLQPLGQVDGGLAYSTSTPFELVFDLGAGDYEVERAQVAVPRTGEFLVSVRVEPVSGPEGTFLLDDGRIASVGVQGWVKPADGESSFSEEEGDGKPLPLPFKKRNYLGEDDEDEEEGDGKPLPLPFDEFVAQALEIEEEWTPFRYASKEVVYFSFSEVRLEAGEQMLIFEFDLRDWIETISEPIVEVVGEAHAQEEVVSTGVIDVSRELDSREVMASHSEILLGSGSVTSTPVLP